MDIVETIVVYSELMITTEIEYQAALEEIDKLWYACIGTSCGDRLEALIEDVIEYENRVYLDFSVS